MEPFRIALRCIAVFVFLLILLRVSGKSTIQQGSTFDFVLALILGDLVDDAVWAEVPIAQFMVAAITLVLTKLLLTVFKTRGNTP